MALTGGYKSKDFKPCPQGVHQAVLFAIYDLGTQTSHFQGKVKQAHKILFIWELPHELREDGKPYTISRRYSKSMDSRSSLRKDVEAWLGKTFTDEEIDLFDPTSLIGKNCQLQVLHERIEDRTYSNIVSIMALSKGMQVVKPTKEKIVYNIEDPIPADTPEWIKKLILASAEYADVPKEETDIEPF